MLQSKLFTKTTKNTPHDETSFNAQMLIKAGFIDKLFAGTYTMLPLGLRVLKNIEHIIREEIDNIDGQEVHMPALHPLENYKKTGRDQIDVLFHTQLKNESDLVLGQSHEEVIAPLIKKFILSYKDLPRAIYQFQTKFRNELRAKSGIMRGREFLMKDLYSFHTNEEDLNKYYKLVQKAYFNIFARCGILDKTYFTFASGGTFSKYSHEFQAVCEAGEDIIHVCEKCSLAINEEIIKEQSTCPNCNNTELKKEKSIELGNIFKLGNRFTKAFDAQYTNRDGEKEDIIMGTYGIGLGRLMGTIVELHNDENGIIWPEEIAPFRVHLVLMDSKQHTADNRNKANEIYESLQENHIDVLFDDRSDVTIGEKFADADLIGCSYRIIVSNKTIKNKSLEIKNRSTDEVEFVKIDEIVQHITHTSHST